MSRWCVLLVLGWICAIAPTVARADEAAPLAPIPAVLKTVLETTCFECHNSETAEGGLNLQRLSWKLDDAKLRTRWVRIHDRISHGEMPPDGADLPETVRTTLLGTLQAAIHTADANDVARFGRGPMRRLNRDEYQQNLRDVLQLPALDIRDILPEDREGHLFNKTATTLDISRVQLTAYLEAAEAALLQAIASGVEPPPVTQYWAVGAKLFTGKVTFGNREAMFFAKDAQAIDSKLLDENPHDPDLELALFRSAHWPYYGYPQGFVAGLTGEYRVRFSARSVLQQSGYRLEAGAKPLPMTFRARQPSGADVSGDVRATGGILDIKPTRAEYETTIRLRAGETFEYSLLGLPVPLARNVDNGPPTYRYPPFPAGGQPGVAIQWLEVTGPLSSADWPPASHRVLFDDLPIRASSAVGGLPVEVLTSQPREEARRLLRRFIDIASRQPVSEIAVKRFEQLVFARLKQGAPFAEAVLTGYKAFLCSGHVLFLPEPLSTDNHFAIASRLSHFLTNSRPDAQLQELAARQQLRSAPILEQQTQRLIASQEFDRFVKSFTDYWLNLRHVQGDEPDVRLYPEYRFDAYLVESMERETRAAFADMIRENRPVRTLIKADYVFANDRLAEHYQLPAMVGSMLRKTPVPPGSPYGGLLTQAAILKVTANGTSTSPVIRGAWVMERLLGQPPPPPPASVPAVEPDIRGAKTIRELLALHTQSASCAGCHARFDPVGLALENFDIMGAWRVNYRGVEQGQTVSGIDRAGHDFAYTLASPVDARGKLLDGRPFNDIHELKKLLAADTRQLARNVLQQFIVYATGTPVRFSDRQEIESMLDACANQDYRIGDLLQAVVHSQIFLGPAGCRTAQ